jgi:hypothetical protein
MANGGIIGPNVTVTPTTNYPAGNQSFGDLKLFCQNIIANSNPGSASGVWSISDAYTYKKNNSWTAPYTDNLPTAGGTQTINSVSIGSYDYVVKRGDTTLSSFTYSDYFTNTNDSRSSILVFNGNLTVNSGVTIVPRNRKLFTCIYVNGNLTVNGSIEMTLRGANHSSASGSNISSGNIKIAPGPFSPSVTDPQVPSSGGAGGAGSSGSGSGVQGSTGTGGGTGGGSGGGQANNGANIGSPGQPGSSFSGGPAGAWAGFGAPPFGLAGPGAETNGGRGSLANNPAPGGFQAPGVSAGYYYAGGGNSATADTNNSGSITGSDQEPYWGRANPAPRSFPGVTQGFGQTAQPSAYSPTGGIYGNSSPLGNFFGGTGGVLIIMCTGTLSGTGTIRADGWYGTGGEGGVFARAAAGAGSVTVICLSNASSITPTASCGPLPGPYDEKPGGAGTARILTGSL